ncbi:type II toxin-antitoxin system PemK/MazF family toxin [Pontibacter sp. E15-1]|uniref:type II toxin-antitoxin system PemK/MazF family toxin n=1 Tax=Pontibacter sp. E15-1 TaxID=2919918 RepID=UPI001F4F4B6A|nr:type II toxin-antitoxin system PemK/MazF family toxin [Pontibacter sp. E15-1]MCJ8166102.1 type II toxin-antitoxin system PemK/MazF family toxin [Pontibacter sp. E15-1]
MRYRRGDVVRVPFPFTDLSDAKKRPALIISNDSINVTGDYLMMMVTSKVKSDDLSIGISDSDYTFEPLELPSSARVHKIFLCHESLIIKKDSAVTDDFMSRVVSKLNNLISERRGNIPSLHETT